ncbi:MAG: phosphopentomutase [Candidatus Geothermincolia bacterium]
MTANSCRIIWIVLDGVGMGSLPDARDYGDEGASTLQHVLGCCPGTRLPHLSSLGLGNIMELPGVPAVAAARGAYGRMAERSPVKDSAGGHWELAGHIVPAPFPLFPRGFPPELIHSFENAIGRGVLGNRAASGTEILEELGREHLATGKPIVYTSADSVFQVAVHKDVIPLDELYRMCEVARGLLAGEFAVARVIARPFIGGPGAFQRVNGERRDYSIPPTGTTLLDCAHAAGVPVCAVGKIPDLFGGRAIDLHRQGGDNEEAMRSIHDFLAELEAGVIIANLVDFDTVYGHRNDAPGFAAALERFDAWLPSLEERMRPEDICVLVSDHGCDPCYPGTDHTREYALLILFGASVKAGVDLGTRTSFADCGSCIADLLHLDCPLAGESFAAALRAPDGGGPSAWS